jgi:hypothetical protein
MTREEMPALARRVEQANGPDPELDALIVARLRVGTEHLWASNYPVWEGRSDERVYLEAGMPSFPSPAYTALIDVALALAPEDRNRMLHNFYGPHDRRCSASVFNRKGDPYADYEAYAATPALAL